MTLSSSLIVITDEVSQDLTEVARFVREFQMPGFELRSMFGHAFKDLSPQNVAQIRNLAQTEGWRVYGCATPVFKCPLADPQAARQHVEIFKRSLETALTLQCDLLRVFTFLRLPTRAANLDALPRVADHLLTLADIARGTPVRIGIENELSCTVATSAELSALFKLLPDPRIGIVWDPCNILYLPDESLPITRGYDELRPRIMHIHVKDAVRKRDRGDDLAAVAVPVGVGEVNWRAHLGEIGASAYAGALSLETHWRRQQLDEKSLHLPAGYAFSQGGTEASRTCVYNLQALLGLV